MVRAWSAMFQILDFLGEMRCLSSGPTEALCGSIWHGEHCLAEDAAYSCNVGDVVDQAVAYTVSK
jgi:hypothetical protein